MGRKARLAYFIMGLFCWLTGSSLGWSRQLLPSSPGAPGCDYHDNQLYHCPRFCFSAGLTASPRLGTYRPLVCRLLGGPWAPPGSLFRQITVSLCALDFIEFLPAPLLQAHHQPPAHAAMTRTQPWTSEPRP